jgi:hypothetical protein
MKMFLGSTVLKCGFTVCVGSTLAGVGQERECLKGPEAGLSYAL